MIIYRGKSQPDRHRGALANESSLISLLTQCRTNCCSGNSFWSRKFYGNDAV